MPTPYRSAYTGPQVDEAVAKATATETELGLFETSTAVALAGKSDVGHTHPISQVTSLQAALDGKAAVVHTHAISDVVNLQTSLDGKAPLVHSHAIADVTGLQTALDGKAPTVHTHTISEIVALQTTLNGKAAVVHSHVISDTTGLQAALDAKAPSSGIDAAAIADASISNAEFERLDGVTSNIQVQLDAKLATANALSEFSTNTTRAAARSNLDVLWADDARGLLASRTPRGGLADTAESGTARLIGASGMAIGLSDFTIHVTTRLNKLTSPNPSLFGSHNGGNNRFAFGVIGSQLRLTWVDGSGVVTNSDFTPDAALVAGETYALTFSVVRGGLGTLYVNGISDRDKDGGGIAVDVSSHSAVNIGSGNANGWYAMQTLNGVIYSIRVFARALAASEVLAMVKAGLVTDATSLLLDADMANADPSQSLIVRDNSTNANDGTAAVTAIAQVSPVKQLNPSAGITIGSSTLLKKLFSATASLDFGSIGAAASADLTITVTGAAVGDGVVLGPPAAPTAGIIYQAFVTATNTVTVRAMNITLVSVDPAAQTFRAVVLQF